VIALCKGYVLKKMINKRIIEVRFASVEEALQFVKGRLN